MSREPKQISISPLRLIEWCAQRQPMEKWSKIPKNLRGIYVLHMRNFEFSNVVYVGMAASGLGIFRRIRKHYNSPENRGGLNGSTQH
jgi:hypothetical protein